MDDTSGTTRISDHPWATHALPERVMPPDHAALRQFLDAHAGTAVRLSALALRRCDTFLVQALIAACRRWTERGLGFELADVPPDIASDLDRLGVTRDLINWKPAT